ncbi:MAG TPA: hypothetical protein VNB24_03390 [Acidimicrobiales bacterium]|nr:hypothetical protein [Acidimicrobiales bacterium]
MTDVEAFAEFAHDLRGAMGSLRLVMSSLVDEDDAEQRRVFLTMAEDEVQRVAVTATALPALGAAASDQSTPVAVDLSAALADAAAGALRYGVRATVQSGEPTQVLSRPDVLALVLPAVFQLAAGTSGATVVVTETINHSVAITCRTGALWPQARHLFARLVLAANGTAADSDELRFLLPEAP